MNVAAEKIGDRTIGRMRIEPDGCQRFLYLSGELHAHVALGPLERASAFGE